MVHNRRNSLAMAGLVDNENAENLQVNEILLGFWKYGLGPVLKKSRTSSDPDRENAGPIQTIRLLTRRCGDSPVQASGLN